MKDVDEPIHAFSYIDNLLRQQSDKRPDSLETAVISRIPDLILLSRLQHRLSFFLLSQMLNFPTFTLNVKNSF